MNKHVFTFLGTMSGGFFTYAEDQLGKKSKGNKERNEIIELHQQNSKKLRTDLWTLYEYISPHHKLFVPTILKYSTSNGGEQTITKIMDGWSVSGGNPHTDELIMIYTNKKITT